MRYLTFAVIAVALGACKPMNPVRAARDEFELLPSDAAAGTSKLYVHGDFLGEADVKARDEGAFIGRLTKLFGPRADHRWVLRHKRTGLIVTAYTSDSGPAYGGTLRLDDPAVAARKAADPVLAHNPYDPKDGLYSDAMQRYIRHLEDAEAGPELAAVVKRLDDLVSQVSPTEGPR